MRFVAASSLAALLVSLSASLAQDADEATAPDPSLDALLQSPEPESELDTLSRTPDDPFPNLEDTKKRMPVSVTIRALDKITARYTDIEAPIGETAKYGSLEIMARFCDKRPPEEFPETTAFLEIFDRDLARARASAAVEAREFGATKPKAEEASATDYEVAEIPELAVEPVVEEAPPVAVAPVAPATPSVPIDPDRIFAGWMFASSPALNPLEHPIYDVWVIDCKTVVVDR
ncbi:MAG: DUF2155 domain-containing protein [Parvularculaceae bacterium]